MAGGYYDAVEGDDFPPDVFDEFVRDQVVSRFPSSGARSAAIVSPSAGQPSYLYSASAAEGPEFYNTAGGWTPPWNVPWGITTLGSSGSSDQALTSSTYTDVSGMTLTWTGVAGRRYRVVFVLGRFQQTVAVQAEVNFLITDGAGTGSTFKRGWTSTIGNDIGSLHYEYIESPGAGTFTRKLRALTTVGSITLNIATTGNQFWVEDIGPSGAPT